MRSRTLLLLALLLIVAGGGLFLRRQLQRARPEVATVTPQFAAVPQPSPRIQDDAAILEPFVPMLGRMADAISTDLGIAVRVGTSVPPGPSIEKRATARFEQRQIGRDAPVGGLLIVLNPRLGSA